MRPDCVMATSLRRWPHLNVDVNGDDDDDDDIVLRLLGNGGPILMSH